MERSSAPRGCRSSSRASRSSSRRFDVSAYSKVGAAGIWQFMPATGRLFMEVNDSVDERRDPIASTRGAARYLSRAYDRARHLAARDHVVQPRPQRRGARDRRHRHQRHRHHRHVLRRTRVRLRVAQLLRRVPGRARDRAATATQYFGPFPPERLPATRTVMLDRSVDIFAAAPPRPHPGDYVLADLNPALLDPVVSGRVPIPAGYGLRLPAERRARLREPARRAGAEDRGPGAAPGRRRASGEPESRLERRAPRVKPGQTLSGSRALRVSVQALRCQRMGPETGALRAGAAHPGRPDPTPGRRCVGRFGGDGLLVASPTDANAPRVPVPRGRPASPSGATSRSRARSTRAGAPEPTAPRGGR